MKTWKMLKAFSEDKSTIATVVNDEIRNDKYHNYDFISLIDGVFYWNNDTSKPFRLNDFYNVLDIEWKIQNKSYFKKANSIINEFLEMDVEVTKASLQSHLKQCKEFIELDNKVKTFTDSDRNKVEEKIERIKTLLKTL